MLFKLKRWLLHREVTAHLKKADGLVTASREKMIERHRMCRLDIEVAERALGITPDVYVEHPVAVVIEKLAAVMKEEEAVVDIWATYLHESTAVLKKLLADKAEYVEEYIVSVLEKCCVWSSYAVSLDESVDKLWQLLLDVQKANRSEEDFERRYNATIKACQEANKYGGR
jgi:hypothetical protein